MERTWLPYTAPQSVLFVLLVVSIILLVSQFASELSPRADRMWLKKSDLPRIEAMLVEQPMLAEENVREVVTMQLRNIVDSEKPVQAGTNQKRALCAGSMIVVLVSAIVLLMTCYPTAVFLWGDERERYEGILQRRRVLWGIIIGVTLIGVASRFLSEGISSWLP